MKKGLKCIAFMMSAALVLTSVGCGKSKNVTNSKDVTEVTVWTVNSHSKETVTKLVDDFNENKGKKLGIKIKYELQSEQSYSSSLDLAFQAGTAPDLFAPSNVNQLVAAGNALPLEELPNMEKTIESLKQYMKININIATDGKVYNLPVGAVTRGLIYNKDMFKAAGIVDKKGEAKPPKTWKEFREVAKKLTNVSKKEYGVILPMKWSGWFDSDIINPAMASIGHCGFNPVTGKYDYMGMEPIMETYVGIIKDGSCLPGSETIDNDQARARFAEGQIGMKLAYSFDAGVLNDQFKAKCDWGVAELPVIDINNRYYQPMSMGGSFMVNPKTKVDKEKISEVLKFFVSDEFVKKCYEDGVNLPCDPKIIDQVKLSDDKKGWKEFAELIRISKISPSSIPSDIGTNTKLVDNFINKVSDGQMTSAEALKYETESKNEGMKTYANAHPEFDSSSRIIKDWDAKLK